MQPAASAVRPSCPEQTIPRNPEKTDVMTPFVAELLGTLLMILLGNGVVANVVLERTKGRGGGWIVITTGWALAVFVGVVVAGPFSGAHLNPAVTLGFALTGQFAWSAVPGYVAAQLIGAAAGAALVWLFYYAHLKATEDPASKLDLFCTSPAIADRRFNFAGEMIATFVLIFSVFYISDGNLTLPDDGTTLPVGLGSVGALPVAFIVWAIGLSLGGTTGYAINPARDLAPRAMHALLPMGTKGSSRWSYAWIPVLGPLCGAAAAALLFSGI